MKLVELSTVNSARRLRESDAMATRLIGPACRSRKWKEPCLTFTCFSFCFVFKSCSTVRARAPPASFACRVNGLVEVRKKLTSINIRHIWVIRGPQDTSTLSNRSDRISPLTLLFRCVALALCAPVGLVCLARAIWHAVNGWDGFRLNQLWRDRLTSDYSTIDSFLTLSRLCFYLQL